MPCRNKKDRQWWELDTGDGIGYMYHNVRSVVTADGNWYKNLMVEHITKRNNNV